MQQQAERRGEQYSATCVCVRVRACVWVGEAVPQAITKDVTVLDSRPLWACLYTRLRGFALRQSSVPSTLYRTLRTDGRK